MPLCRAVSTSMRTGSDSSLILRAFRRGPTEPIRSDNREQNLSFEQGGFDMFAKIRAERNEVNVR